MTTSLQPHILTAPEIKRVSKVMTGRLFYSTTSLYYLIIVFKPYTMIYHSIPEYIQAKTNWENETAVVTPETINGLPVTQYYKVNSKPRFEQPIYENPDGTKVATGLVPINKKRDTKIK